MSTMRGAAALPRGKTYRARRRITRAASSSLPGENWKIMRTRHELFFDWAPISALSEQSLRSGFSHVIGLCGLAEKDEVVVENIAPSYRVGRDDPAIVIAAQERIASVFRDAIAMHNRDMPEYRLSLRRGSFDIRFYLGRTRPTDFRVPELDC